MASVHFSHGRLHVGYRARDWSDVWYEPIGDPSEDGNPDLGLFSFANGERKERGELMEGEIHWHPPFDVALCESKFKRERVRMQNTYLISAHIYLNGFDRAILARLEREWDCPDFARWQVWFRKAKKWKRRQLRERARRRAKAAQNGGARDDLTDNESDDDSTYDSENQRVNTKTVGATMPPPKGKPNPKAKSHVDPKARRTFASKMPRTQAGPSSYLASSSKSVEAEGSEANVNLNNPARGKIDGTIGDEYDNPQSTRPKPDDFLPGPAPVSGVAEWDFGNLTTIDPSMLSRPVPESWLRAEGEPQLGQNSHNNSVIDLNAGFDEDEALHEAVRRSEVPEDTNRHMTDGPYNCNVYGDGELGRDDGRASSMP